VGIPLWSRDTISGTDDTVASYGSKVAFSVFCWIPVSFTTLILVRSYVVRLFNNKPADDVLVRLLPMLLTFALTILSWALIFEMIWLWDAESFTSLPATTNPYDAWVRMMATAQMVCAGVGFGPQVADRWYSLLVVGFFAFACLLLNAFLLAAGFDYAQKRIDALRVNNIQDGVQEDDNIDEKFQAISRRRLRTETPRLDFTI